MSLDLLVNLKASIISQQCLVALTFTSAFDDVWSVS